MASTGVTMSAKSTAASTSWRRTGWSVTSAHSSGVSAISKNACVSRSSRYSGSDRPAWRMNHTGVRSTGSRRQARTRSGSAPAYPSPLRTRAHSVQGTVTVTVPDVWLSAACAFRPRLARCPGRSSHAGSRGRSTRRARARLAERRVEVENAGTATWRDDIAASYHWLDERGNAIVWDGVRTPLRRAGRARASASSSTSRCARRCRPAATASPSTSSRSTAPGSPSSATSRPARRRRAAARRRRRRSRTSPPCTALRTRRGRLAPSPCTRRASPSSAGAIEAPAPAPPRARAVGAGRGPRPGLRAPAPLPVRPRGLELERLAEVEGLPAFRPPADEPWIYDASLVLRMT